jgi:protein-S-isoprenylcysteine O-methyltransferase Ste14
MEPAVMKPPIATASLKYAPLILGIPLAFAWGMFSYAHFLGFRATGDWTYLLFCAAETLAAVLFLVRSEAVTVSRAPLDWVLAISATFAPFLFAPAAWGILPQAKLLLVAGSSVQIAGLLSLNRSFGLVPAKREIKTAGLYRIVRHPLYASYFVSFTGYVLANTSIANLVVYACAIGLLFFRLLREEKHLALDLEYRAYMSQVKYRIVPLIF